MKRTLTIAALAATLVLAFTCVRDAQAQAPFPLTTVHAIQIAQAAWGPCDGPITVQRANLGAYITGEASEYLDDGIHVLDQCTDGDASDNIIWITDNPKYVPLDWLNYCSTIVHEDGHLHGVGHAQAGTTSIMAPSLDYQWKHCLPRRAWKRDAWIGLTTDKSLPGKPDPHMPMPDAAIHAATRKGRV